MNLDITDQNSVPRQARTLPSWLSASSSTSSHIIPKNGPIHSTQLARNVPGTAKPEFTECDDAITPSSSIKIECQVKPEFTECDSDISLCSSTNTDPHEKPEFTEGDADISLCSSTNEEPSRTPAKPDTVLINEEIRAIEAVFMGEVDDIDFIHDEGNVASADIVDSTSADDSFSSNIHEAVTQVCDQSTRCKAESTTLIEGSSSSSDVPEAAASSVLPTSTVTTTPSGRLMCIYRHKCYRTNPQHKLDFSHPGDADYDGQPECDSTSSNSTSKPRCRYGRNCYRKNDEHKQKFYHSPPRMRKRNALLVESQNTDSSELVDSDQYEDSFIDDESSDEFSLTSTTDEENGFSDFEGESSSDDEGSYPGPGKPKKKKFSIF